MSKIAPYKSIEAALGQTTLGKLRISVLSRNRSFVALPGSKSDEIPAFVKIV